MSFNDVMGFYLGKTWLQFYDIYYFMFSSHVTCKTLNLNYKWLVF